MSYRIDLIYLSNSQRRCASLEGDLDVARAPREAGHMANMNFARILLGGLVAGVVYFIGDGLLHGKILTESWQHSMAALGRKTQGDQSGMGWFALYDLMKGLAAVWIYAA